MSPFGKDPQKADKEKMGKPAEQQPPKRVHLQRACQAGEAGDEGALPKPAKAVSKRACRVSEPGEERALAKLAKAASDYSLQNLRVTFSSRFSWSLSSVQVVPAVLAAI